MVTIKEKGKAGEYTSYWRTSAVDFRLDKGQGFFMYCDKEVVINISGTLPANNATTLLKGWNVFGLTQNDTTAEGILSRTVGGKVIVIKDDVTGKYKAKIKGYGSDFDVERLKGIYIYTDRDTSFKEV